MCAGCGIKLDMGGANLECPKCLELNKGDGIHRHCFEVATGENVFFMYADTEKQKDEWIGAIGRAIVKFSGVFHNKDEESSSDDDSEDDEE